MGERAASAVVHRGVTRHRSRDERTALVEDNLPLVDHVVFQVAVSFPRHVDRRELAHAGALGLLEAADRWDADRGIPFPRFAAQRIRGAILDAVRAVDWAPRSLRRAAREIEGTTQQLTTRFGRAPSNEELARHLDIDEAELASLQARIHRSVVLALDEVVTLEDDDEELSLGDVLTDDTIREPEAELEHREMLAYLRDAVHVLPERHRIVIVGYFFEGRTSAELAEFLSVTESRVSQLRSEAFDMIRAGITAQFEQTTEEPVGRAARRRASYAAQIAGRSRWQERIASHQNATVARPAQASFA